MGQRKEKFLSMATSLLVAALFVLVIINRNLNGVDTSEYRNLDLDQLSGFDYPLSFDGTKATLPDGTEPTIPNSILRLDGQKVRLSGFMMPMQYDDTSVLSFLLLKDQQMCCFGMAPQINQFVTVGMTIPIATLDTPVTVYGTLQVGEVTNEQGQVLSLYRLAGHKFEALR